MTKINEIQKKLNELNGGEFQKLMDVYFSKKFSGQLFPIGSVIENNNTKTGTPDTLIRTDEGKYVFVEYTVQKGGILNKFKDDIKKCLDIKKTNIAPEKIKKIICCFNTRLSTSEIEELSKIGESINIEIDIVSIDSIGFKLSEYPNICKEFLGISIDTQQILDMEDFIRLSDSAKLATPLDIDIYGRDEEVREIVESLREKQVTILSGAPGVGKTRLSLECLSEYVKKNPDYKVKCLRNNGQNLYNDLNLYFGEAGNYILLIDDANLLTDIQIILDLMGAQHKNINVKLMMTVREYAESKVFNKIRDYDFKVFKIRKLTEKDITSLCNFHQIYIPIFISRVWDISLGNPRLAVMACTIIERERNLKSVENVMELIEKYYKDISLHFESELQNADLLKVASIIGFLGSVHLKDSESTELICEVAEIEKHVFLQLVATLHSMEIIDIFEEELVKVSDQILNTYIFFTTIFKKNLLSYNVLIKHCFPKHKNRFIENFNNVFSYFYKEEYLSVVKIAVNTEFENLKEQKSALIEEYLHTFSYFLQIEGLLYVQEKISKLSPDILETYSFELEKNENKTSNDLLLLSKYHSYSYNKEAIDLILIYLEKKPTEFSSVYYSLVNYYGFNNESIYQGYARQLDMFKKVREKYMEDKNIVHLNLLIKLIGYFLKFSHDYSQMKNHREVNLFKIPLELKYNLPEIRQLSWLCFEEVYTSDFYTRELNQYLYEYAYRNPLPIDEDILKFDQKFIEGIIGGVKEPDLEQLIVFKKVIDLYKGYEIFLKKDLLEDENNEYIIYKKLFSLDHQRKKEQEYITTELGSWIINFSTEEFTQIFRVCKKITQINFLNTNTYIATRRIEFMIQKLSLEDRKNVLSLYFNEDIDLMLSPRNLLEKIEDIITLHEIELELEKSSFQYKSYWLICLYHEISNREISDTLLYKVYGYFENLNTELKVVVDISFLENFLILDQDIFKNVINALMEKEDAVSLEILSLFLAELIEMKENIQLYLRNDFKLLKRLFLRVARKDNFDFDSSILKAIINIDSHMFGELLNDILRDDKFNIYSTLDSLNLRIIWEEENWSRLIEEVSNVIVNNIEDFNYSYQAEKILGNVLILHEKDLDKINKRILSWVDIKIEEWAQNDKLIEALFKCLTEFPKMLRIKYILKILNIRPGFEFFIRLPFLPSRYAWTNSQVPTLNFRKQFFIDLHDEIEGIRFLEHKKWLQERIVSLENKIKATKINEIKRDI